MAAFSRNLSYGAFIKLAPHLGIATPRTPAPICDGMNGLGILAGILEWDVSLKAARGSTLAPPNLSWAAPRFQPPRGAVQLARGCKRIRSRFNAGRMFSTALRRTSAERTVRRAAGCPKPPPPPVLTWRRLLLCFLASPPPPWRLQQPPRAADRISESYPVISRREGAPPSSSFFFRSLFLALSLPPSSSLAHNALVFL